VVFAAAAARKVYFGFSSVKRWWGNRADEHEGYGQGRHAVRSSGARLRAQPHGGERADRLDAAIPRTARRTSRSPTSRSWGRARRVARQGSCDRPEPGHYAEPGCWIREVQGEAPIALRPGATAPVDESPAADPAPGSAGVWRAGTIGALPSRMACRTQRVPELPNRRSRTPSCCCRAKAVGTATGGGSAGRNRTRQRRSHGPVTVKERRESRGDVVGLRHP